MNFFIEVIKIKRFPAFQLYQLGSFILTLEKHTEANVVTIFWLVQIKYFREYESKKKIMS